MYTENIVFNSPNADNIFCYSPHIIALESGRLVLSLDLGGDGVSYIPGPKSSRAGGTRFGQGKIFVSDDDGKTWVHTQNFPFWHARLFLIGNDLLLIGHDGDIRIAKSEDEGETWTEPSKLTNDEKWHAAPCNVLDDGDFLYLCMEQRHYNEDIVGWNVSGLAPRLLCLDKRKDPLMKESWEISAPIIFRDIIDSRSLDLHGIPFYLTPNNFNVELAKGRKNSPIGWLEGNVVKFYDENHIWHDPTGNTFHIFLRAHTGSVGYGCLIKIKRNEDGTMLPVLENVPSGKNIFFLPIPGGHLKFFIHYDKASKLYWMVSSQSTDSMRKLSSLDETDRFGLPNNERHRLQLLFSKNCIDWCFATMIASGDNELLSRNYPSFTVKGNDMHVVMRSGDGHSLDSQYTNCITHKRIPNFRELAY